MENRKIIYIYSSNEERSISKNITEKEEISDFTEKLKNKFKENEYIVYTNNEEKIDEIIELNNKIKPDIFFSIHTYNIKNRKKEKGPIIYTNNENTLGDNIAKKIYEQLKLIYYDPTYDKGIIYTENINEIVNIKSPSVYLELFCYDNENDFIWYVENKYKIINAIYIGIDNYFKDRD